MAPFAVCWIGIGRSRVTSLEIVPTRLAGGHAAFLSSASVQAFVASGLPTRPGGRWMTRSFGEPSASWKEIDRSLFEPACCEKLEDARAKTGEGESATTVITNSAL